MGVKWRKKISGFLVGNKSDTANLGNPLPFYKEIN